MSLIHNERLKLTAAYLNTVAAAIMIAGVVAPLIALTYDLPGPKAGWQAILISLVWLFASAVIHWLARRLLRGLQS